MHSLRWGVLGRQARQVRLDADNRVLFSVASCAMRGGFGFPELCCDDRHCTILLPFLNASMKKVPKRCKDRDVISDDYLRCEKFCHIMHNALSYVNDRSDLTAADDDGEGIVGEEDILHEQTLFIILCGIGDS